VIHFFVVTLFFVMLAFSTLITTVVETKRVNSLAGGWLLPPYLFCMYIVLNAMWFMAMFCGHIMLWGVFDDFQSLRDGIANGLEEEEEAHPYLLGAFITILINVPVAFNIPLLIIGWTHGITETMSDVGWGLSTTSTIILMALYLRGIMMNIMTMEKDDDDGGHSQGGKRSWILRGIRTTVTR